MPDGEQERDMRRFAGAINISEWGYRLLACGEWTQSSRSVKQEPTEAAHADFVWDIIFKGKYSMPMRISCRLARKTDAREIARLFRISADGYADYTWSEYAKPGEDLLDVGEARFSRENTEFSYQNCILAENAGLIVGLLHSYPLYGCSDIEKEGESENVDPVFNPFIGMEAPHSLYIPGLAVHKIWRDQGVGSALLSEAHRRAQVFGLEKLSLICFSSNSMALRFYQRHGFSILRETPLIPHPQIRATGKAFLMTTEKPVKL